MCCYIYDVRMYSGCIYVRVEGLMYVYIYAVNLCTHTISILCYAIYASYLYSIVYVQCSMEYMYMYTNICNWG